MKWFAPWGYDPRESNLAINLQYIVILLILVYSLWGYTDFSSQIVSRITSSFGAPTATSMGRSMSSPIESKALKATGLDATSRAKMKQSISASIKSHTKAIKQRSVGGKLKDKVDNAIDSRVKDNTQQSSNGSDAAKKSNSTSQKK